MMDRRNFIIVAIDGGAASGKSTTARRLSERFNLLHVDTGSYYRAVTAALLHRGVSASDRGAVIAALSAMRFETRVAGRTACMGIDGALPTAETRGRAVNESVSHFASIPELRAALLSFQRGQAAVAQSHGFQGLVMEGRDIGSVIFPEADFRFFLEADLAERARRRTQEGQVDSIAERDHLDSIRSASPLRRPSGSIAIDTTHQDLEQVVDLMSAPIAARLAQADK